MDLYAAICVVAHDLNRLDVPASGRKEIKRPQGKPLNARRQTVSLRSWAPNYIRPQTCFSDLRFAPKASFETRANMPHYRSYGNVRFASSSTTERACLPHFNVATCGFRSPALARRIDFGEIEFRGKIRRQAVLKI